MAQSLCLSELFEGSKYPRMILTVSAVLLLLLEAGIFFAAASQSGLKSRLVIADSNGTKLYESSGTALSSYEKMVFESNFGPIRNYATRVETELVPFPYRTWILLAIGIPLGLILLMFFLVRVWMILLNGRDKDSLQTGSEPEKTRMGSFLSASRNVSILHVGFAIVALMLVLWLIPSFLGDVFKAGFDTLKEYPWFFVGLAVFAGGLLCWVIYLRYRLSRQMLCNQLEIEKYRIQRELLAHNGTPHQLASPEMRTADFEEPGARDS
ncbi:MAG: hypothetical protein LLG06_14560 [Desulfobacteraceae bacterium]|nr:hypothetical protein [Desulfobacteraceae bacterium]